MNAEISTLKSNGTWKVVELPTGKHAIGYNWVSKIKLIDDGSIERCKARLVAQGYIQIECFDFQETFNLVAKQATVRLFLALEAAYNWTLSEVDVNNTFLNGDMNEKVFMELPNGYQV